MRGHENSKQHSVSLLNQNNLERVFCLLQQWDPILVGCKASPMAQLELLQVVVL
jgi:hypothetical protein